MDREAVIERTIQTFMKLSGFSYGVARELILKQVNKGERQMKKVFTNKIPAIKELREVATVRPEITKNLNGDWVIFGTSTMGLKEAKDMVEAIMFLGAVEYLRDSKNFMELYGNPCEHVKKIEPFNPYDQD